VKWWVRSAATAAVLAVLVWRVGTGPFLDGLRTVDGGALAAAAGLAVLTTVCCAWRWRIVARGLGVDLPMSTAVAGYYRSIFLNVTLPGGVVADALPNVGGWGPREGVTAWAFAAAGLGASRGVATAVAYGAMVFVASLPGAAVLAAAWVRRDGAANA
jgi:hypothetical protein